MVASAVSEPELVMPSIHGGQVEQRRGFLTRADNALSHSKTQNLRHGRPSMMTEKQGRRDKPPQRRSASDVHQTEIADKVLSVLGETAAWSLDVIGGAFKAMRRPISWLMAAYLFAGLVFLMWNLMTRSVYSALSPVCRIPGASMLGFPFCPAATSSDLHVSPNTPVEFDQLINVQGQFEEILDASAAGIALPLDMKRSEASLRDLRQVVRFSSLNSKQEMNLELDGFIETARIASYDLQKFNSHVGRGVDIILSTARWTQRVLDDVAVKSSSRGLLPAFVNDRILAPFKPLESSRDPVLNQYIEHTRVISKEIETLLDEAQALLYVLQNLEDRLEVIQEIALRDDIHAQGQKEEILSQLWTVLGGNRAVLGKYNSQLKLLRQVGQYRKDAWTHVASTIVRLQGMGADLEELRERVSSAELLPERREIPLTVHLESIKLGVERLEKGRSESRELEQAYLGKVLNRDQGDKDMRLVDR